MAREKEETARGIPKNFLKVEAITWKGGEFKKSGRKRSGRRKRKKKVKNRKRKWWKKCKELIVSLSMTRMKKGKEKNQRQH